MPDNAMDFTPSLTLAPDDVTTSPTPVKADQVQETALDMSRLSASEQQQVHDFAQKIDITDTNIVLTYGAAAQKNIADFSAGTLDSVRTKDMGEVGDMLSGLVVELKGMTFGETEKKGLFGIRKKIETQIAALKAEYDKASDNVDKIVEMLEKHQITLLKDAAMLDKMYDMNKAYFKELTMYILAGKETLQAAKTVSLPQLQEKAAASGKPEDAQAFSDYMNLIDRFEKKLYDLELTRTISMQMAPQIRLIQNNDSLMVQKIQTSLVNTIPLWKSQMVLALGLHHSQQAMQAQREVTDMTNALLKKNAEMLKTGTVEVAKESERGIADIETLQETNRMLIETLDEVRTIQAEGAQKRQAAELELGRIENELKQKLLDLRK
ncbi:toxic anion resistance protein [Oscillospiraceae bacterium WX1]